MWQYGGMDVPFCDPSLTNTFGLGPCSFGYTQPTFGTYPNTFGTVPFGTPTMGFTPYVNPLGFMKPDWNPFFGYKTDVNPFLGYKTDWNPFFTGFKTDWNPFFGYKPEWNPFFGYKTDTMPYPHTTPYGIDKLNMMKLNSLGINPWFVGHPYGFKLAEELWKTSLPISQPMFSQTSPFHGTLGWLGTHCTVGGYTPFGYTGLDEKLKFGTPFSTGLFGFQTTPIDWKLKSFGTSFGVTPETWTKPVYNNVPWTTGQIQCPVAVL